MYEICDKHNKVWCRFYFFIKWAASSEFVSSSIPLWQTLTAHAQPFRGARALAFCLKVLLDSRLVLASSEGSGETARMRRLAWTFAARIGDKYQIRLTRSKCDVRCLKILWDLKILWELASRWAKFCEILSHSVRYCMYDQTILLLTDFFRYASQKKPLSITCKKCYF